MSNFVIADPAIGAPSPISQADTVQRWPLGFIARGVDNASGSAQLGAGMFQYVQGSNVSSAGALVQIQNNSAVLLTNNVGSKFPVGVVGAALSATNLYGWVQVQGICDYARGTNSAIAAGAPLYGGSFAGIAHTASVASGFLNGIVAPVAYTSSQSLSLTLQLQYPTLMANSASL